jgi:hypothetical protein
MGGTAIRRLHGHPAYRRLTFAKATLVLEGAVQDLLLGGWDEDARRLVHGIAGSLRQAAHHAGWGNRERALRAIESFLDLSARDLLPIRQAVGEKLLEVFAILKNVPASRSA